MQTELEALDAALGNPKRPVVAIVGGAKVSTKIELLEHLVTKVDALVIGGGMANTFLAAQGVEIGKSLAEADLADTARRIVAAADKAGCAIVLPVDVVVAAEFKAGASRPTVARDAVPADRMILDVGPKSIAAVNAWIDKAATRRLERPARRLRNSALRHRDACRRPARGRADASRQTSVGRRRRRYRRGPQPAGVAERFLLRFDRRRRFPRMDGRQGPARRRGSSPLTRGDTPFAAAVLL